MSIIISRVVAFDFYRLKNNFAATPDNLSTIDDNTRYAASYLAPFASEDAVDHPFELINSHEDLTTNLYGSIISLNKRTDDCQKYHKVAINDNCYTLSLKYQVDMNDILEWNSQINSKCTNLYPGKSYCVQKKENTILNTTLKNADNCNSITKKYGITLDEFYNMNPSINRGSCNNLRTGKAYCIKQEARVKSIAKKRTTTTLRRTRRSTKTKKSQLKASSTNKRKTTRTKTTLVTRRKKTKTTTLSTDKRKLLQKRSEFTYYWIAHPDDYSHSGKQVTIKTCQGKSLGTVSEEYADALVMEGTGIVNGKIINLGGCSCSNYKCFMEVDKKEDPFGLTAFGSPLRPFITIAANDIKRNTKIFIPQIVGWEVPGSSKKHNGCLLADDRSWSFDNNHIDFYVYREKNYRDLNKKYKISEVDVYEGGNCNLLNYL
ncbi:uncharacterized protein BX663DRAFT_553981 [Cokeromyces recurvatus]|uniref:uncharacterized protein n=1 Tax=Cokeromyces recurvatus TaxID=90255 RepID=UPI00221F159B|nr:uncharacterized protein BX663DRAFT_553981 [Cokeromyces recurvatus]KAI7900695.1 hypothetical protein BX663DRAFT_553981 [Cokeromyces recurvatus]